MASAEKTSTGQVALSFKCLDDGAGDHSGVFDLVIAATGYNKSGHQEVMEQLSDLIDGHHTSVNRDYRVNFQAGLLAKDCGLWLQGSLGEPDDVSARRRHRYHC